MSRIRIVLVDDHVMVRKGLRVSLDELPDLEVVGEASDGFDAVRLTEALGPDVVLMDIKMPGMNGLQATRTIYQREVAIGVKVIMLTAYDRDEHLFEALRAGASGFLLKDCRPEQLVDAVRTVAGGDALLAPSVTRRLISEFVRRPAISAIGDATVASLTTRELEVFKLLAQGLSNEDIAQRLVLEESTIKSHVKHVYQKLGVRDRTQVVIYAYEHGLVSTG